MSLLRYDSMASPRASIQGNICLNRHYISRGLWYGDNPLNMMLSDMMIQVIFIFIISRTIHFLLRPFRQPKFICNLLAGIILGPSILGCNKNFRKAFRPNETPMTSIVSLLSTVYFVFLIAVKTDMGMVFRTAKNAWRIALTGSLFTLFTTLSLFYMLNGYLTGFLPGSFTVYAACSLSFTYFPVISHALYDLNLITSELGQLALSLAMIVETGQWVLIMLFSILQLGKVKYSISAFVSMLVLIAFTIYVIRPGILLIIKRTPAGKPVKEIYIVGIFIGVAMMSFISDMLGFTIVPGAVLLGFSIPDGPPLGSTLIEKAETFVSEVFLPFMFVKVGYDTDVYSIKNWDSFVILQFIMTAAYFAKLMGTLLASLHCKITLRNSLLLSLIVSIKGYIELITYNSWRDRELVDAQSYTQLVLSVVVMTMILTPLINIHYNPQVRLKENPALKKQGMRSIQASSDSSEFRVICCVHNQDNVHSIITFLEASNPTELSPLSTYVIHLVELVGRAAPFLIHYKQQRTLSENPSSENSEYIMRAFENYSNNSSGPVLIQPFTLVAPYKSMHDRICTLAHDEVVPFILVPFQRNQKFDLGQRVVSAIQYFNSCLQAYAPCTVGILVDRGSRCQMISSNFSYNVAVIFIGGADDREALALAARMSGHFSVSVTVLHMSLLERRLSDYDEERRLDECLINEFSLKNISNPRVVVKEIVVEDRIGLIDSLRCLQNKHDLVMVGRLQGDVEMVDEEMSEFIENAELGVIGDMLASTDFCGGDVSVLIMHHYNSTKY